ncbi:hypothetical protein CHS0354_029198 [Potamilus streckersoni]|uniref:Uncharacterized protein n=1 Tax=Potamilus streckersoni TaxID=2493646 RepID=A0AAE0WD15_9BIVA|nr:hypothetical protein CHS0354_029198 [Potamilus streckersoni]
MICRSYHFSYYLTANSTRILQIKSLKKHIACFNTNKWRGYITHFSKAAMRVHYTVFVYKTLATHLFPNVIKAKMVFPLCILPEYVAGHHNLNEICNRSSQPK